MASNALRLTNKALGRPALLTVACLCALALAAPSVVAFNDQDAKRRIRPEMVLAPSTPAGGPGAELAAADEPPCSSRNTIAFDGTLLSTVRHLGKMRCQVPTDIRCESKLLDLDSDPPEVISSLRATGRRACSFDSGPSDRLYELTHPFRERFLYRITLVRRRHVWGKPSDFCPRVSRDRKTLTCRASHDTIAPVDHTVRSPE